VKDPGVLTARKLRLTSKDRGLMMPEPGDPLAPTAAGAVLEIVNPSTAETATIPLPPAGWTTKPSDAVGGTIYRYRDPAQINGPCKVIVLKGNRALKAKCEGAQLAFTLDEASQGTLDLRLVLSGGFARCLSFGGAVIHDEPGQFVATAAARPSACAGGP
jgi:hypothetical protein